MDIGTLIGLVLGIVLIAAAILLGGSLVFFISIPSFLIVVGGTIASVCVRHKVSEVVGAFAVMMKAFVVRVEPTEEIINQLVEMANIARKDGILALEKVKSGNAFLQGAVNQCVDGADPEFLTEILSKEVAYLAERHRKGVAIMESFGEFAPVYGVVGSLIGLIQMLASVDDPASIGPAMSLAFLSTFYGLLLAYLWAVPIAGKLGDVSADEQLNRRVIIDGMMGIQKGINPRSLQEALKAALPTSQRDLG
ncbi:MAG: MotA/TolQ/ExbB proton channel family protein [Magnetococcales bacterium]|nr:MotA/TolQ/ExbB proton channel family protein [Magnetococcales bacterium]MBF0155776.1 MotA/TolQ/ExbB proton channel family protein [Magnetococcales bacterium]